MTRPRSAVDLGLQQGTPPPPERHVTPENWLDPPFNRWGFRHVRELARTARIPRGDGPVHELESVAAGLEEAPVAFEGATLTLTEALHEAWTDGFCVVHDGRIVLEHYVDGMGPDDTHLLMSVSKSLTSTLVGVLVEDGVLATDDLVTDRITALRGTSWEGCTVQHLLDMRAGTRFEEEDYEDPDSDGVLIDEISGYRTRTRTDLPAADTYEWIAVLDNDGAHGGPFKYRSILTDVLAWVAAEATGTRFPDLFAQRLWSRLGAERDAEIIVDEAGFAAAEGGMCTTLRDLARFGVMHLQNGVLGGRRVVPEAWITRLHGRDDELVSVFGRQGFDTSPEAFYHDGWWVLDGDEEIYSGFGIFGQQLLIHRPSRTVIAKFSTWPTRSADRLSRLSEAINLAVLARLG
jgi:CubicO group peptidase (beta-lactamase class C family)